MQMKDARRRVDLIQGNLAVILQHAMDLFAEMAEVRNEVR